MTENMSNMKTDSAFIVRILTKCSGHCETADCVAEMSRVETWYAGTVSAQGLVKATPSTIAITEMKHPMVIYLRGKSFNARIFRI